MNHPEIYTAATPLPVSIDEAFAYHERPGALFRLIPPWESVELEHSDESLKAGSRVVMKTKIFGLPFRWVARHTDYDPPELFADTQVSGPFLSWDHRHEFSGDGSTSTLRDHITYQVPFGFLGKTLGGGKARRTIEAMFAYRHRLTRDDLQLHADRPTDSMTIAISGSTGMVGRQLSAMATLLGHRVRSIVRSPSDDPDDIAVWSSDSESKKLEGVDAVVHLAGKPIANQRWSEQVKREIRDSRVIKTRQLCESLARLDRKPSVLICASAAGVYGDRGDELLTEASEPDDGFLADVVGQWEDACRPAIDAGIRVVNTRFGLIFSPRGGALQKSLLPAKFGGGSLGSGNQWWSWIALDDAVGGIYHAITDSELSGPVNYVSPSPTRNADFAKSLGRVLNRPSLVPAPAAALRVALGEMADDLLLASARVVPERLQSAGYRFRFTDLEEFLRFVLGKNRLRSQE